MSRDVFEEDTSSRLRQRLWGAAVLIAIAVIVLPLLLDGAGSESKFKRVENLREEPPAILGTDGTRTVQVVPQMRSLGNLAEPADIIERVIGADKDSSAQNEAVKAERTVRDNMTNTSRSPLTALVVRAAEFDTEIDAIALRDRLRKEGFASFVRDRDADTDPFQVLVGPMIKQLSADRAREAVARILQNDPDILTYP